jgi:hypothetical protein
MINELARNLVGGKESEFKVALPFTCVAGDET